MAAVACFLALRCYARTNQPRDLRFAQGLAEAHLASGARSAAFFDGLIELLHHALWRAYGASGRSELDYLRRALDLGRRALESRALDDDDDRVSFVMEHVIALQEWSQQTSEPDALTQAVLLWRRALALARWKDERTLSLSRNFALGLRELPRDSVDIALVAEEVITFGRRISADSNGAPARQLSTSLDLADWLSWRFGCTGALRDLEEQISVRRRILQLCPTEDRANCCDDLGGAFVLLSLHAPGRMRFLDEFVAVARESLQLRPQGDPARNVSCHNLVNALSLREKQTGDRSLFEEIIAVQRELLLLDPPESTDRATSCNNLAHILMELYLDTYDSETLDEAEALLEEAIRLTSDDDTLHALACSNLNTLYQTRYAQVGDPCYLDQAVELHEKALAIPGQDDLRRAEILNDLGNALWNQMCSPDGCGVRGERAMTVRLEALALTSPDHPMHIQALLGLVYIQIDQSKSFFDPLKAIDHLQKAMSVPASYGRLLLEKLSGVLTDPHILALPASVMPQLVEVYDTLLTWLALPNYTVNMRDRLYWLSSTHGLGSYALACAIKAENITSAVELLEHGRALLWKHALNLRDSELENLPEDKRREIESLRRSFSLSITPEAPACETHPYLMPRDLLHEKAERLQELIAEVRSLPGHERFMRGRPYADLAATARSGPVVILSGAADCHAIIIPSPAAAPIHVPLAGLTPDDLKQLSLDCIDSARNAADLQDEQDGGVPLRLMRVSRRSPSSKPHEHLAVLWHKVVAPIFQATRLQVSACSFRLELTCSRADFVEG
jgi:tetratricopeptide (TPR) repeat protein